MTDSKVKLFVLFIIFSFCFLRTDVTYADIYNMQLQVQNGVLDGQMEFVYVNMSKEPLNELQFRLDMNLGKKSSIQVTQVKDESKSDLAWEYRPLEFGRWKSEHGQMRIDLPNSLQPEDSITLYVTFRLESVSFINAEMITLQDDPYHSLDAWYPKAMSLKNGNWSIDDDRPSEYRVKLEMPSVFTIASTGKALKEVIEGDTQILELHANNVRGFSIYASTKWKKHRCQKGNQTITVLLPEESQPWASRILDAAFDTIAFYEKEYGLFPTEHLEIICLGTMNGKAHGSSAACNMVILWFSKQFKQQYRFLIAHELAHQYFGCSIGLCRKEINWAPIGLGLMMDREYLLAQDFNYKQITKTFSWFYLEAERRGFNTQLSQSVEVPLKSGAPWSSGWNMSLMHGKALHVCLMLEDLLGKSAFKSLTKEAINKWSGKNLSGADFAVLCGENSNQSLDWFFEEWVDGRQTLDYALSHARKSKSGWDVDVQQKSSAAFPIQIEAMYQSGERVRRRIDREKRINRIHFPSHGELKQIIIDPCGIYPDVDTSNNNLTEFSR